MAMVASLRGRQGPLVIGQKTHHRSLVCRNRTRGIAIVMLGGCR